MKTPQAKRVGFVSLGCPKALVDSERILTQLRQDGYDIAPDYDGADVVVVNTCGFIDSAKAESLEAIGEALEANGRVIVTGCMGKNSDDITRVHPKVLAVTGPQQYEDVVSAVHRHAPQPATHDPFTDLVPPPRTRPDAEARGVSGGTSAEARTDADSRTAGSDAGARTDANADDGIGIKLTPRHYAYLKISEGCNHKCRFCIIPSMRGRLVSRPVGEVLGEAERLVAAGVKELLVISQDTSAYGVDLKYKLDFWGGRPVRTRMKELCEGLGSLGAWVRLHYVYPYPHVDDIIPLMAENRILPYLDVPFQHGSPAVLKRMRRPAAAENTLERIRIWRGICPELTIRSTFIVGFPGETEAEFEELLDFLEEAQLDRVGCFQYSPVEGAAANDMPGPVPDEVKQERWEVFMQTQARISRERLQRKVGTVQEVLIDDIRVGRDEDGSAIGRSTADAPEIDGIVTITDGARLRPGDRVKVRIEAADDYDLFGRLDDPQ
ncbi:30S ribosomal protein S12 methylthiotransferase RimO [Elongatibacter sediminis]|uniref:Ribosomal protein uS12 methylthiotransferase RimO n=1 Tax=Elongatibacter sediminis TaxID=3119006 RepID=A0AAW9R9K7_9GAMM